MALTILYVEDHKLVADAVRELLAEQGWIVELCADGNTALNKLAGATHYDLLLLDNDLPAVSGLELTRYARSLPTYRETPIIMLSATDCRADALRAGADLFLGKPKGIAGLVAAVRQVCLKIKNPAS